VSFDAERLVTTPEVQENGNHYRDGIEIQSHIGAHDAPTQGDSGSQIEQLCEQAGHA
jgi:hypothetical protein